MMFPSELNKALQAENVLGALYETAVSMKNGGVSKENTYAQFEALRAKHSQDKDETIYNAILDVMDCIVGWCSPHLKIYD